MGDRAVLLNGSPIALVSAGDWRYVQDAVDFHRKLVDALKSCISNHCRDNRLYCSACTPARQLLAEIEAR